MQKEKQGDWQKIWDARSAAMTTILGAHADDVFTAAPPFYLGGFADVVPFPSYVPGMTYATADLTGPGTAQIPNRFGQFELVICMKQENERAADLISRLARYTCDVNLEPFQTMDLPPFFGDALRALIFLPLADPAPSFEVLGQRCGLLLCLGITSDEVAFAKREGADRLLALLKAQKVFPYTIPERSSVLSSR